MAYASVNRSEEEKKEIRRNYGKREKKLKEIDKIVKKININFTGKFFGFVFDRKVTIAGSSPKNHGYGFMRVPYQMAGKSYTVILIPKELNTKIFEKGERVDWNQFYDGAVRDGYFNKFKGGTFSDFDKSPSNIDISDDEMKL